MLNKIVEKLRTMTFDNEEVQLNVDAAICYLDCARYLANPALAEEQVEVQPDCDMPGDAFP